MNRNLYTLVTAQFISAFADNAVLFTVITLVMQGAERGEGYVPLLQASFLIAFVLFAPWVGPYSDRRPKARVLMSANGVKAVGAGLLLAGVEPLIAYALIGIGAAYYSPAKYGILPELVPRERLVNANGWVEGATILAILGGSLAGAAVAEVSIRRALDLVVICYLASAAIAFAIPKTEAVAGTKGPALKGFLRSTRILLASHRARFSIVGVSLFWAAAAVLRVTLVAWAPLVLAISEPTRIAELTLYSAVGIAIGAVAAPRLVPLEKLRRARLAAYLMGAAILLLAFVDALWPARGLLLIIGVTGGIFLVPINAALQEVGHRSVGAGNAVAVQHFFENATMLIATGGYAIAAQGGVAPAMAMVILAGTVLVATAAVALASRRAWQPTEALERFMKE